MRSTRAEALVLCRRDTGEADRLVTFFTQRHGIVRVYARGVRRIPSRRGGHVEPVTYAHIVFSNNGRWHYLMASDSIDYFDSLRGDPAALTQAQALGVLVAGLFDEGDPQPYLFRILLDTWRRLSVLPEVPRALLEVVVMMISLQCAGLLPGLASCYACGRVDVAGDVVFDAAEGGWRCVSCAAPFSTSSVRVSGRLLAVMRRIVAAPTRALEERLSDCDAWRLVSVVRAYSYAAAGVPLLYNKYERSYA